MPELKWPHLRHPSEVGTYVGECAEAVVLMAYLAKFGEWPLTARELMGEQLSELAGRLPPMA